MSYTAAVPILAGKDLQRSYGDRDILRGASVTIHAGERLGLVGSNGSGKTTLARILAGAEEADGGEVVRGRAMRLAYLAQDPKMDLESTALDVALSGLDAWSEAVARHERCTERLSDGTAGDDELEALLHTQASAAEEVERLGGWELRHQAEAMLGHLGVSGIDQRVGTMSGGERRRVAMARLLVSRPDVAILDEPTNHLDIATIEWLEQYLQEQFGGALLLITHDRYLLDRVVTRTLELDSGVLYSYDGGWGAYLTARAERAAHAARADANRRNFLRRELEWLSRQPKARTTKSKSRIDRAHAAMDVESAAIEKAASIEVGATRSGKTILDVRHLDVEIAGLKLVKDLSLSLVRGDRIGIVGPNGAGKTTLIRALLGQLEPAGGEVSMGKNTRVAYLDQTRAGLDDEATVRENIAEGAAQVKLGDQAMDMRTYLQRFLFDGAAQLQKVGTLSGGERARVALARVLREGANLVVLDEPTNDLDVTTLGALEASLLDFAGTLLVVTHDRWFLDRIATSILGFTGDGRVVQVQGGYRNYVRWQKLDAAERAADKKPEAKPARVPAEAQAGQTAAPDTPQKLSYRERKELDGLMERIDAAESEIAALEAELETPEFAARDYKDQATFLDSLASVRTAAEALVERWSELEARSAVE